MVVFDHPANQHATLRHGLEMVIVDKIAATHAPFALQAGMRSNHALCENPAARNRTRDHLIAAGSYSQMLYQLSYSRE